MMSLAAAIGGQKAKKKGRDTWITPKPLICSLAQRFGPFGIDAAAQPGHWIEGVCDWFGPGHDDRNRQNALKHAQDGRWWDAAAPERAVFLNPPFSMLGDIDCGIGFMHAAKSQANFGVTTVALCPGRIASRWFHDFVLRGAAEIWIPDKRIRFFDPETGERASSPSVGTLLCVYRPNWIGQAVIRGCQMQPDGGITGWK